MNKEIKEILDYLKIENGTIGSELSYEETHLLLDYITNLQNENEELKKNQRLTPEQRQHLHLELDEILEIYKQRIDKAIEYITNEKHKQTAVGKYTKDIHKNLLKILGGDE